MMAIILTSGIPARLVTGFVLDRVRTVNLRMIIGAGYLLQAAGVTAFVLTRSVTMIYVWFLLFGIGSGITQSVQIPLWGRYFGRKAYGAILGSTMAMNVPVALVAPVYIGSVYDRYGSYMGVITALAILSALSGVLAFFIRPPARQGKEPNSKTKGRNPKKIPIPNCQTRTDSQGENSKHEFEIRNKPNIEIRNRRTGDN